MDQDIGGAIVALKKHGLDSLPPLGIVLGSGLGSFADEAAEAIAVGYAELPGFPVPSVEGHAGRLVVGAIEGRRVALFQGRGHYYERGDASAMRVAIDAFKNLGGATLLLTNAAGGLRSEWKPPALVAVTDHINFSGTNPLIGHAGGDRFVPLTRAYDPELIRTLRRAAGEADVALHEGVYMWFSGPSFETPAEIRAAQILGADLVGMSTVPEVILARRAGLRVGAVSVVTNYAAGLSGGDPSHDETQEYARLAADQFKRLLRAFVRQAA
ncbi:purine-nucleoside phosphorylase [Roseiarcus fermentans]|uniref:Purine nucleoside phosphorylase n=1 Tax=Roseiarcus fermentans TaxID=1473586 RepID=A0A366F9V1_9HYPH|nr:purine-nucleoside phosphorylase [Roseiarcus fermentans]RBP10539.1 purine-nucleoside phosphorylase [Roseiarcus fermentans]